MSEQLIKEDSNSSEGSEKENPSQMAEELLGTVNSSLAVLADIQKKLTAIQGSLQKILSRKESAEESLSATEQPQMVTMDCSENILNASALMKAITRKLADLKIKTAGARLHAMKFNESSLQWIEEITRKHFDKECIERIESGREGASWFGRIHVITMYLLKTEGPLTVEELAAKSGYAASSIQTNLTQVRRMLNDFQLDVYRSKTDQFYIDKLIR